MAKYMINHSCGCDVEHNIVGTNVHGERDRKREWLASEQCRDCQRASVVADAVKANMDYVRLDGSPKQVAWAETIRAKAIPGLLEVINTAKTYLVDNPDDQHADKVNDTILRAETIISEASCRWWIDNRVKLDMMVSQRAWLNALARGDFATERR